MRVQVENRSNIDFVGTFRDKPINIPAGKSIEMGRSEAVKFLGEWSPVRVDGAGRHMMPKSLYLVENLEEKAEKYGQPLKYTAFDGQMFRTTQGLEAYEAKLKKESKGVIDAKPTRRRRVKEPSPEVSQTVSA